MEAPPLERKLAAILAADVEGYSRLMHSDEEQTLATLTSHRTIVDALIESAHGQIFGTAGDSVLAEFPSVVHAFQSAVAIQQAIWQANKGLAEERRMSFRIGINVGDVLVKNGDIFGDGVNIAARLEALADVGGICVSRGVRDHLRDRVEAEFEDLGEQSFKNISRPLRVFRVKFDPDAAPVLNIASPARDGDMSASDLSQAAQEDDSALVEVAFWQSVQEADDPSEYRLYLQKYPEGQFAELAASRIDNGGVERSDPDVEIAYWETVRESGDERMLEAYLEEFPQGRFAELANLLLVKVRSKQSE